MIFSWNRRFRLCLNLTVTETTAFQQPIFYSEYEWNQNRMSLNFLSHHAKLPQESIKDTFPAIEQLPMRNKLPITFL